MNYSTKLSRRKMLLLLTGAFAIATISLPSEAAKKKGGKTRSDRYYPRDRNRNYDDSTPSPTPSPTPPAPEPYRPTSPVMMFGVGGGVLGAFGFLGAWLVKMNQKPASAPPSPPARKLKAVKKAAPEVADWYVFRNGKAEGPYSKLELWEIQKITARTNIRRDEETEWTRACEIPELAKYLSEK